MVETTRFPRVQSLVKFHLFPLYLDRHDELPVSNRTHTCTRDFGTVVRYRRTFGSGCLLWHYTLDLPYGDCEKWVFSYSIVAVTIRFISVAKGEAVGMQLVPSGVSSAGHVTLCSVCPIYPPDDKSFCSSDRVFEPRWRSR